MRFSPDKKIAAQTCQTGQHNSIPPTSVSTTYHSLPARTEKQNSEIKVMKGRQRGGRKNILGFNRKI